MKPLAFLAAASAAAVTLAACSQASAPSAAHVSHKTVTHSAGLASCPQEYAAWKASPAGSLTSTLNAVDAASRAGDMPALKAALKKAGPVVLRAARYPIPACADPKGYWTVLMMHVNSAASTTRSASVTVALKGVPKLERELSVELKAFTGVK
jgi:hypothetical protein